PQVDADHAVDHGDQQDQPGTLLRDQAAEAEDDAALVLPQDPDRRPEEDQDEEDDDNDDADRNRHISQTPFSTLSGSRSATGSTSSVRPSTDLTRTLFPSSTRSPSVVRARHRAPFRKICPSGSRGSRTSATDPISSSYPVRTGSSRCAARALREAKTTKPARITPATLIAATRT